MTLTITQDQFDSIAQTISPMNIPKGLGTGKDACTVAAINIALGGCRVDTVPACMSPVIGAWIICIQDAMPDAMRNSIQWKALVPFAAGTGREHETQRLALIYDHMWRVSLPLFLPVAINFGFEPAWQTMLKEKTSGAAATASAYAYAADAYAADSASSYAAGAYAADAARAADAYAAASAYAADAADAWNIISPINLLRQLIEVTHKIEAVS